LFVWPQFRGRGIGKALLTRVAARAAEQGCVRLQWDVLEWNQAAIDFYQEMGAQFLNEWRIMRVNDQAIGALASLAQEPIS
jgi:GNAT superfamily N-acetyltransferase